MAVTQHDGQVVNYKADRTGTVHVDNPSHAATLASVGDTAVVSGASRRDPRANIKDAVGTKSCPKCAFSAWAFSKNCPRCKTNLGDSK